MPTPDAFPHVTTDQLEGDDDHLFAPPFAFVTPEVVAEVERVAAMLAAYERGEGPREFVSWLDDEVVPSSEWLAEHGEKR